MTKNETLDWLYRLRSNIGVYMPREWCIPMIRALDVAIKTLEQQQWIPCSERLPAERMAVLVYCLKDENIFCAYIWGGVWRIFTPDSIGREINHKVVAWCELPQPWGGEEE